MAGSKQYINNRRFYEEMVAYRADIIAREVDGREPPRIPNYIGSCFMQICTRLSTKPNFSGYTYREEMVSDAIENCVMVVNSFNPEKSTNPFAYFTQIAWNAFIRRIAKEKKQQYIKHKNMDNVMLFELVDAGGIAQNDHHDAVIKSFEDKMVANEKKETAKQGVERFQ